MTPADRQPPHPPLRPDQLLLFYLGPDGGPLSGVKGLKSRASGQLMAQVHSDECCSRSWGCRFHTALTMRSHGGGGGGTE